MKMSLCLCALLPLSALADTTSFYCPQNHGYIKVGMTQAQVVQACGQPMAKKTTNNPVVQQIPVTQLYYTNLAQGAVYSGFNPIYNTWSLPSGTQTMTMQVNLVDDKVSSISINGSSSNASTLCGSDNSIQIGSSAEAVYDACGNPSMVNYSYNEKAVSRDQHPEVWLYKISPYQPGFSLTFVNGTLQSINASTQ